MKQIFTKCFFLALLLSSLRIEANLPPQGILGLSVVNTGQINTYTYSPLFLYDDWNWQIVGGTLQSESLLAGEYSVTILWTTQGQGTITFSDVLDNGIVSKNVTINSSCTPPPDPVVSISVSSSTCPPRTLSYTAAPPTGVTWYWQTAAAGTSTTYATNTYSVSASGTYFVRAFDNTALCWSAGSASYAVTVTSPPGTPSPTTVSTNSCGAKTITRGTPPTGVTWFWQGTDPNGTSTAISATTYSVSVTGTYYLRARDNASLCWSASSRATVITISPALPMVTISSNTCGTKVLSVNGTPPNGTVWYWQGTTALGTSTSNSDSTYNVTASGTYYIRARIVLASCWSPTATAIPVVYVGPEPATPIAFTVSTNYCGNKTLTKPTAPGGITYFWQGANSSGTDYTSGNAISSTYIVSSAGYYYLRARNNSTGCWSASSYSTNVYIDTPAPPVSKNFTYCEWETMTLTTTGYPMYGNLSWFDMNNAPVYYGLDYTVDKFPGVYSYKVYAANSLGCLSSTYATVTLTVPSSCDDQLNWAESIGYTIDANGDPLATAASRSYTDGFGNPMQSQSKSFVTNQVLAAQPVYDKMGNPSLNALPAPINSSSFVYKHKFVTDALGKKYGFSAFDLGTGTGDGELYNPKPVGNSVQGTLGWYYSANNNLEPNTPVTSYPYSRSWAPEGPDPVTGKSAGPGDQHKMGSGHEVQSDKALIAVGELDHYFQLQKYFVAGPSPNNTLLLQLRGTAANLYQFAEKETTYVSTYPGDMILITSDQTTGAPGTYPIGGIKPVVAGKKYTYYVRGYNYVSNQANLYVTSSTGTPIVWPGPALPTGAANIGWVSVTFTAPAGVTGVKLGVVWSQPVQSSIIISDVALSSEVPTGSVGYKYTGTDPNGKQAVSFVDADGSSLASATKNGSIYDNWSYTFYNATGQVVATVEPNGVNTGSTAYPSFVTLYKYDHLGRLIETTATDEGTTQYVYSNDGKIRFSQNQEQRNATFKRFSYTNYDYLGRLIESGEYTQSGTNPYVFEPHSTAVPATYSVLQTATLEAVGHTAVSRKLDAVRCSDYTYIEYDKQASDYIVDGNHPSQSFTYGQVTKTENANAKTWYSYDEFGQLVWTKQDITGLGIKTVDYAYDFLGNVTEVVYQKGQADDYYHHYVYNADQQLTEVWTSLDGTAKTLRAKYYYYLHGPLKRVELASNVQGMDFVYTINGALKTINNADPTKDPGNDGANGFAPDVFGQTMHYYDNDYTGASYNAGSQTFSGYTNQFGGALKGISWNTPVDNNMEKNSYAFTYDNIYQLSEAKFGKYQAGTFTVDALDSYKESIPSYDKNGNIQSLLRKGLNGSTLGNYGYVYETNTNKLDKVNHNSTQLVDYSYNTIGQMTQQVEGSETMKVSYNAYGITKEVRNAGNQLMVSYVYDDRGDLVKRIDYTPTGVAAKNTFYVRDASGNPLAIYEQVLPSPTITLIEVPVYGSGRVALFKPTINTYFYEIGDHLGNVRAVIGTTDTDVHTATMESENVGSEIPPFKNIAATRVVSVAANHTAGGNEAVRLNNTKPAGPAISLAVSPGDLIDLQTWAYYEAGSNYQNSLSTNTMIGAIAAAFGGISGAPGEAGQIFNSINNAFGAGGVAMGGTGDPNLPGAYLCYMVFDVNKNLTVPLQAGYVRVTSAGNMAKELITIPQITIEHPGYIYVCVYNRSDSPNWVYFDDMKVTHAHSPIVAGADFFPFGLAMEGREITQEDYRWGYQGQYSEKDSVTSWNQFQLRMYDARFGRWLSVDPYGQFASPYVGMGNAPNMGTDPDGGLFGLGAVASGTLIGAAVGTAIGLIVDPDHWYYYTAGGAGLGAMGGAIYNSSTYNLTGIGRTGKNPGRISSGGSRSNASRSLNVQAINLPAAAAITWENVLRVPRAEYQRPADFPTWDMATNRRIREMQGAVGNAATQFINAVENDLGIQLRITQGFRSIEEQDALYAQGRTTPGEIVTNARGGESYHNYGLAFDVVEMVNGQANWNTTMTNWNRIGAVAQRFGLEWGGNWTTFVDRPHFQNTFGHTIRQLMQLHGVRIVPVR